MSLGVLWFIIPIDVIALVTQWFYNKVISVSSLILNPLPILGKNAWVSFQRVGDPATIFKISISLRQMK